MSRWENIGGKYLLNALGADPLAASQSVAMYLDPVGKCIEWHTNGHVIRLRPDLPSAIISGPFATSFGYEWNLAGGLVFGVGDVSLTKRAGKLDLWGIEGVQIYYIVPVGQIPQTPTIRIEKIDILDGMISQLDLVPQGVLSPEDIADGNSRTAPWVDNSMVLSWANKSNNRADDNHSNYMAGKILHKAPPLAHPLVCADLQAGNTANRSFGAAGGSETIGWYEVLPGGFQKAYDRQKLSDRRGVGTHYAFAATLGYTTIGSTALGAFAGFRVINTRWPNSLGNSDIESITAAHPVDLTSSTNRLGFYTFDDAFPGDATKSTLIANSDTGNRASDSSSNPSVWLNTWNYTGTKPAIVSGREYHLLCNRDRGLYNDAGTTNKFSQPAGALTTALSAVMGGNETLSKKYTIYLTLAEAPAGGIIPQIMHHRQLQRRR